MLRYAFALVCLASSVLGAQGGNVAIRGVVRDSAANLGIAGAIVDLRSATFQRAERSDEVGGFVIPGVPAGTYRMRLLRIGYRSIERDIEVAGTDLRITVNLRPVAQSLAPMQVGAEGAGIYGVIGTARDLRPISGVKVSVAGANQNITTDSAGAFYISIKKPGTYFVRMVGKGFAEEMFPIEVPAERVVDASRLLDESNLPPRPAQLFEDFDQRLRWRSASNSALVTGSELRRYGGSLVDALRTSPSFTSRGLRITGAVCLLVNGVPKPGWGLEAFNPEEIEAMEVYGSDRDVMTFMRHTWSGPPCSRDSRHPEIVKYVSIWLKH